MCSINPSFLFPNNPNAHLDDKCVIISEVLSQIITAVKKQGMELLSQEQLIHHANERLKWLSDETKLSLDKADHMAFMLHKSGVDVELAKKYYSMRLTEEDAKKWIIKIV